MNNPLGETTRSPSAKEDGVDMHYEIFDALLAFRKLVLLFHSSSPWDSQKMDEWVRLEKQILKLSTARHLWRDPDQNRERFNITTKRLCDLARAIAGERQA